jgi:general secretion pathway protein A
MYHTFFDLAEPAFSIAVNPRYLYMSQQHKEALAHLLYGVAGGGFVMLTGEVGTGKTTIIRCLLEQLPDHTDLALVMNPMANVAELLTTICEELGAPYPKHEPSIKNLTDALHSFLLQNHTLGRNTILLIDEAQLLSAQTLEQVRLLTNLETTTQKLLHIILVGQPELKTLVAKPELRQLAQRITARFHLTPLTLSETQAYIRHRLKVAGLPEGRSPFSYALIKRIHAFTGGIPRLINVICERCLMGSYGKNELRVDNATFNAARKEVLGGLEQKQPATRNLYLSLALLCIALVIIVGGVYAQHSSTQRETERLAMQARTSAATSAISSAARSSAASTMIRNYHAAEDTLFNYLNIPLAPDTRPCGKNLYTSQVCVKTTFNSWSQISELNRPVMLVLSTPEKFSTYVVLIGLNADTALVLNEQQQSLSLPLASIGRDWTGELIYVWKKPPAFSDTLLLGDSSPTVAWLAQQFAKIDKQKAPLSDDLFSLALQERIKIFQRSKNIKVDGNITEQTLLKLNETLGADKTLIAVTAKANHLSEPSHNVTTP